MKVFIRVLLFLVISAAFTYLLYYRLSTPKAIKVEKPLAVLKHGNALQRALDKMTNTDDPFAREMEALDRFFSDVQNLLRSREYSELEALYEKISQDKPRTPNGIDFLFHYYSAIGGISAQWEEYFEMHRGWTNAYPNSAAAYIALASAHQNHAYSARGSDWAHKVHAQQWQLMRRRMQDAWAVLDHAEDFASADPYFHAAKMKFLRTAGESPDDRDKLVAAFEKGVAIDPRAYGLHFERIESLLPRWGGDSGAWIRHSRAFGKRNFPEQEARAFFARMVMYVAFGYAREEVQFEDTNPMVQKISWEELDQGFQALTNLHPRTPFFPSGYAVLAMRASEPDIGAAVAEYLGDRFNTGHVNNRWIPHAWREYGRVKKSAPHIPRLGTLYEPPNAMVYDLAFSPDNKQLAATYRDGRVIIWDVVAHKKAHEITGGSFESLSVAFSDDGTMLASTIGDRIRRLPQNRSLLRIHDTSSWELKHSVQVDDFPERIAFDAKGERVGVVGSDYHSARTYFGLYSVGENDIQQFHLDTIIPFSTTQYQPQHNGFANAFGASLQLFQDSNNVHHGFMAPSDTNRYECLAPIRDMAFFDDGSQVVIGQGRDWENRHEDGQLSLWRSENWTNSVRVSRKVTASVNSLDTTPNGKWIFSGGVDNAVTMWDAKDLKTRAVLLGHGHGVSRVRISPDGKLLATSSFDGRVILWDISTLDRI